MSGCYSIDDLSEESGFDRRVIRSFIEQGLLRGPESKGRYARYTDSHLIRLRAIRYLRDVRQMNHSEIRIALLSMSEGDMKALSQKAGADWSAPFSQSSVLDYLRSARSSTAPAGPSAPTQRPPDTISQGRSAVDRLLFTLQNDLGAGRSSQSNMGQQWHRFNITPDIELSVRGLQDGGQIEQWERIADCLRDILLGGKQQ